MPQFNDDHAPALSKKLIPIGLGALIVSVALAGFVYLGNRAGKQAPTASHGEAPTPSGGMMLAPTASQSPNSSAGPTLPPTPGKTPLPIPGEIPTWTPGVTPAPFPGALPEGTASVPSKAPQLPVTENKNESRRLARANAFFAQRKYAPAFAEYYRLLGFYEAHPQLKSTNAYREIVIKAASSQAHVGELQNAENMLKELIWVPGGDKATRDREIKYLVMLLKQEHKDLEASVYEQKLR